MIKCLHEKYNYRRGLYMIKYYNRKTKEYETEKVAGDKYLKWIYASPIGMGLLELLIKKKVFSKMYGAFCDSRRSIKKVKPFVEYFDIDMSHSVKSINEFDSFNDFFTRKMKEDARLVHKTPEALISPGDGRLLAFENIDLNRLVQVKGSTYSLNELIADAKVATKFSGGVCVILRLCPTDYHRFHFVDDGVCEETVRIAGDYYSVNPIALSRVPELFCKNKREWSIFHSKNFGDILHIEVGATCVGSILQTYTAREPVEKGDEKGYFKFGGSTTILFFEKDKVKIAKDIAAETEKGIETKVLMGETIGEKI
jgi:phosphatidylserine decarboxylase